MLTELWVEGVIVEFQDGMPCHRAIIRQVGKSEVVLANILDGSVKKLEKVELDSMNESGNVKFLAESRDFGDLKFTDLTEKEQLETNRRYRYVKNLQEKCITKITEKSSNTIIYATAKSLNEKAPHWQSVRIWYKNFVGAGNKMRGLYPKHRYKGSREPKIDKRVLSIIRKEAKGYFKLSQPSIASVVRNVEAKIIEHNLDSPNDAFTVPSFLTIQKRVLEVTYQHKQKTRIGVRAFQTELAGSESNIKTSRVLERVEIDHTLLDIHVLHDDHKTLLGRPTITFLIDHYSHMLLGFQLSFEKPSFASVCMASMNAFLQKEDFIESLGCDVHWPAHGIPAEIVTDNGNEFWGKHYKAVADEIGW